MQCQICSHAARAAIERDLIGGESVRNTAQRYAVHYSAVWRHWSGGHVNGRAAAAAERADTRGADDLLGQLRAVISQLQRFLSAVDEELADPSRPGAYYLGPRAEDVDVIYTTDDGTGHPVRQRARLSALITQVEQTGLTAYQVNVKSADVRDLLIKAADSMGRQLRILGEVEGLIASRVDVKVNVLQLMPRVVAVLDRYPDALAALRLELAQPARDLGAVPMLQLTRDATPPAAGGAPKASAGARTAGGPRARSRSPKGGCSESGDVPGTVRRRRGPNTTQPQDTDSSPLLKVPPSSSVPTEGVSTK